MEAATFKHHQEYHLETTPSWSPAEARSTFTVLGIFRFDFPNQKKLLAPTTAVECGGLEKNRPKGQDWKGLMLRWREQFQMTHR